MSKYVIDHSSLSDIANAIRERLHTTDTMKISDMPTNIRAIASGRVYSSGDTYQKPSDTSWRVYGSSSINAGDDNVLAIGSGTENGRNYGASLGVPMSFLGKYTEFSIEQGQKNDVICLSLTDSPIDGAPTYCDLSKAANYRSEYNGSFYKDPNNASLIHDSGYSSHFTSYSNGIDVQIRRGSGTGINSITLITHQNGLGTVNMYLYFEALPSLTERNRVGFTTDGYLKVNDTVLTGSAVCLTFKSEYDSYNNTDNAHGVLWCVPSLTSFEMMFGWRNGVEDCKDLCLTASTEILTGKIHGFFSTHTHGWSFHEYIDGSFTPKNVNGITYFESEAVALRYRDPSNVVREILTEERYLSFGVSRQDGSGQNNFVIGGVGDISSEDFKSALNL